MDGLLARCVAELRCPELPADVFLDAVDVIVDGMIMTTFEEDRSAPPDRRRAVLDVLLGRLGV